MFKFIKKQGIRNCTIVAQREEQVKRLVPERRVTERKLLSDDEKLDKRNRKLVLNTHKERAPQDSSAYELRSFSLDDCKPEFIFFGNKRYLKYDLQFGQKLQTSALEYFKAAAFLSSAQQTFLPLNWQSIDERTLICDIGELQSLSIIDAENSGNGYIGLQLSLLQSLLELSAFYRDNFFAAYKLCLERDFIFYNKKTGKWYFCLLPLLLQQKCMFSVHGNIDKFKAEPTRLKAGSAKLNHYQLQYASLLSAIADYLEKHQTRCSINVFALWHMMENNVDEAISYLQNSNEKLEASHLQNKMRNNSTPGIKSEKSKGLLHSLFKAA